MVDNGRRAPRERIGRGRETRGQARANGGDSTRATCGQRVFHVGGQATQLGAEHGSSDSAASDVSLLDCTDQSLCLFLLNVCVSSSSVAASPAVAPDTDPQT